MNKYKNRFLQEMASDKVNGTKQMFNKIIIRYYSQ